MKMCILRHILSLRINIISHTIKRQENLDQKLTETNQDIKNYFIHQNSGDGAQMCN